MTALLSRLFSLMHKRKSFAHGTQRGGQNQLYDELFDFPIVPGATHNPVVGVR